MKSETRRLNRRLRKITGASKNLRKSYKVTAEVAEMLDEAGIVHGQKSRAVQIAVEILWRTQGSAGNIPEEILNGPLVSKAFKLPLRTISLIKALAIEYDRTLGNVLAACAVLLAADVKETKEWERYWKGKPRR